jgi:hypothetical protein
MAGQRPLISSARSFQFIWGQSEKFGLCSFSPSYTQIPNHVLFLQPRQLSLSLRSTFDGPVDFRLP